MRAPRLAAWLLNLVVDPDDRPFLLADMREEYAEIRGRRGRFRAWLWYWNQALRSAGPSLRRRIGRARGPVRRALPIPGGRGRLQGWRPTELAADLRYAVRSLQKAPGFTAVAVVTLALGIGANTAIFSVVDGVLIDPLPWPESDRLVTITLGNERFGGAQMSVPSDAYLTWRDRVTTVESLTGAQFVVFNLDGEGEPERVDSARVLPGMLELAGIEPALGRSFTEEEFDPGRENVAIVGEGLWKRRFGARRDVVGEALRLDGEVHQIVGVLPVGARLPLGEQQVFVPAILTASGLDAEGDATRFFRLYGRLSPTSTLEGARAEIDALIREVEEREGAPVAGIEGWTARVQRIRDRIVGSVDEPLLMLLGAVAFVLLIACANVANLVLARGASRQHEIAVRAALGAGRWRIVRQLVVETLLLSLVAGGLGAAVAWWSTDALLALAPSQVPRVEEIGINIRVIGFVAAVSVATGVIFGLVPASGISRPDLSRRLAGGGRGEVSERQGRRLRDGLTVAEVALALVLLVGAGLMLRTLGRMQTVDPGFRARGALDLEVALPEYRYPDLDQRRAALARIVEAVGGVAGVEEASAVGWLPLSGSWGKSQYMVEGQAADEAPWVFNWPVTPGYFETMRIPLVRGRGFRATDRADGRRVVVVSEAMARNSWPGEDPLGKRLKIGSIGRDDPWATVVGVVGDVRPESLRGEEEPGIYVPFAQQGDPGWLHLLVRAGDDPLRYAEPVRRAIREAAPAAPIESIRSLDHLFGRHLSTPRFYGSLLGLFAGLAALLAAIGVYGVISHSVARRTREIGVRVALGADRREILALVFRQGMARVVLGAAIGLGLALALSRFVASLLFGVSPFDVPTYVAVTALVLGVGMIANVVPAARALRVDPVTALRTE